MKATSKGTLAALCMGVPVWGRRAIIRDSGFVGRYKSARGNGISCKPVSICFPSFAKVNTQSSLQLRGLRTVTDQAVIACAMQSTLLLAAGWLESGW